MKDGKISFRTIQNASCAIDLTVPTGRNVISASASHPTCQLSPSGEVSLASVLWEFGQFKGEGTGKTGERGGGRKEGDG
ncbi:hypothetical protein RRG08_010751 [Elysia crispata]|uniref:Uncharacterized protein n=1 Tax=Elysia crispata TaxID=231223 RepID=A0AAE0ZHF9_9GAST|nr:hypothetical protein RRG08_010751 [Elysia crispata]